VEQLFRNELNQKVKATFISPLPAGAMIVDMAYWFNGKRYVASVREKKEAQAAYDSKIRKSLDPALLQEIGENVFKLNIAPINGVSDVRFELTYTEILPYELSTSTYTHLLRATGLSPKPLERLSIRVEANTQNTWKTINIPYYGSSEANNVVTVSPKQQVLTFGDENFMPSRNYAVELTVNRSDVEMATLTYVPVPSDSFGTEPFFLSWVLPPDEKSSVIPRSIVFVADVSSSMDGTRMEQLRAALHAFLDGLTTADYFNIVTFSTNVLGFKTDIVTASPENIAEARNFIRTRTALGLTNISAALHTCLTQTYVPNTAQMTVFLTDGEPSWGEVREGVILDSAREWNQQNVRVYPIAVGTNLRLTLLNSLAKNTGGFVTVVEREDSIKVVVESHLNRISRPHLTKLALSYGALQTMDVLPQNLPNVSVGGRVTQHGRYITGGIFPVILTGELLNTPFTLTKSVLFGGMATNNRAVARLWARAKIEALLEEITRLGELKELVNAVIDISIRFNILTKYTALYADPDDPKKPTTIEEEERPLEFATITVFPNPAFDHARIVIRMTAMVTSEHVRITIYDKPGQLVYTMYDGPSSEQLQLVWACEDTMGRHVARGIYTVVVVMGGQTISSSIVID